jgi:hypothetical protein
MHKKLKKFLTNLSSPLTSDMDSIALEEASEVLFELGRS